MSLRHRLANGGRSYGPMLLSDSPLIAELLASVGYDHIVVDHEHGTTDIRSGQQILMAIDAAATSTLKRTEPIVRVPSCQDPAYFKKVLDTLRLPAGILVPMVEDANQARDVVQALRYPRQKGATNQDSRGLIEGIRGCAVPVVRASSWNVRKNYVEETEQDLLLMVQVETVKGVEAIAEIAQVPGIDGIFIGPLDLSCSIGKMGQFDDPEVVDLISRAENEIKKSPVFLAGFQVPYRTSQEMFDFGYSLVCGKVDLGLLRDAAILDAKTGSAATGGNK